jgi:hypothetical protein
MATSMVQARLLGTRRSELLLLLKMETMGKKADRKQPAPGLLVN